MQCVALALILELRGRWADRSWTQLLWSSLSLCAYPTDPSPPLNITHYPRHKHTRTPDNLTTSPLPNPSNHLFLTIMCFAAIVHSTSRGHIAVSLSVDCWMSCQWCVFIYMTMCSVCYGWKPCLCAYQTSRRLSALAGRSQLSLVWVIRSVQFHSSQIQQNSLL